MNISLRISLCSSTILSRVGVAATLDLDFMTGTLDSRITFSRTSHATIIDSTGKITYAPNNILLRSNEFTNTGTWSTVGMSVESGKADPDGGTSAYKIVEDSSSGARFIYASVTGSGASHILSVTAKADGRNFLQLYLFNNANDYGVSVDLTNGSTTSFATGGITSPTAESLGNGWYRVSFKIAALSGAWFVVIGSGDSAATERDQYLGDGSSGILLTKAQLELVTHQTAPRTYNATTSAIYYGPRFSYDLTLVQDATGAETNRPNNYLLQSQTFDNASWSQSNASVTANAIAAPDATTTADKVKVNTTNAAHYLQQIPASTVSGKSITSVYAKAGEITKFMIYAIGDTLATGFDLTSLTTSAVTGFTAHTTSGIVDVGGGWYRCYVINPASVTQVRLYLLNAFSGTTFAGANTTDGLYLWGAQTELVTYENLPRTYNPTTTSVYTGLSASVTLARPALLTEEARTNSFSTRSLSAVTATAGTTAPDGSTNAIKLAIDAASAQHYSVTNNVAGVTAQTWTYSIFLKSAEYTTAVLWLLNAATADRGSCTIDLTTGVVSSIGGQGATAFTGVTAVSSPAGDGWWRVALTGTSTGTAINLQARCFPNNNNVFADTAGKGIYTWGEQLELGGFATSYLPTFGSALTRSVDSFTMTGSNFSSWFNQSEGTFFVDFASIGVSSGSNKIIEAAASNRANALVEVEITSPTSYRTNVRGAAFALQANIIHTITAGARTKTAFAFKQNDFVSASNGVLGTPDTSGTYPASPITTLGIGIATDGSLPFSGRIRSIRYYPTRLANSQLLALTAS